jgi:hypothetical protein
MSVHPRDGVVDAQCRVHATDNFHVAGRSVFPTSGHVNPTLTLVALAVRLADHARGSISRKGEAFCIGISRSAQREYRFSPILLASSSLCLCIGALANDSLHAWRCFLIAIHLRQRIHYQRYMTGVRLTCHLMKFRLRSQALPSDYWRVSEAVERATLCMESYR